MTSVDLPRATFMLSLLVLLVLVIEPLPVHPMLGFGVVMAAVWAMPISVLTMILRNA